jgi:RsiW-degrading membrane proteinase PrsW (M82 family)
MTLENQWFFYYALKEGALTQEECQAIRDSFNERGIFAPTLEEVVQQAHDKTKNANPARLDCISEKAKASATETALPPINPDNFEINQENPTGGFGSTRDLCGLILIFGWIIPHCIDNDYMIHRQLDGGMVCLALVVVTLILSLKFFTQFLHLQKVKYAFIIPAFLFTSTIGIKSLLLIQGWGGEVVAGKLKIPLRPIHYILNLAGLAYNLTTSSDPLLRFLGFVFGVGLWEELIKLMPLIFIVLMSSSSELKKIGFRNFILIGFLSGFGFGFTEYLIQYSPFQGNDMLSINLVRIFSCMPSHAIYTSACAAFLWNITPQFKKSVDESSSYHKILVVWGYAALACAVMAIIHGVYDVFCSVPLLGATLEGSAVYAMGFVIKKYGVNEFQDKLWDEGGISKKNVPFPEIWVYSILAIFAFIFLVNAGSGGIYRGSAQPGQSNQNCETEYSSSDSSQPAINQASQTSTAEEPWVNPYKFYIEWEDLKGRKTNASLLKYENGYVVLQKPSKKLYILAYDKFSTKDQKLLNLLKPELKSPYPEYRVWSDVKGRRIFAKLLAANSTKCKLLYLNKGKKKVCLLKSLSSADQAYIKNHFNHFN